MRMSLYDAAFATIARVNSDAAGDSIVRVTVIAGLESTMFWPLGRWIAAYAWRGALIVSAAVSLANALLLCYFCDHSAGEAGHDLGRIRAGVSAGEDSSTGSRDDVLHRHGARQHGEHGLERAADRGPGGSRQHMRRIRLHRSVHGHRATAVRLALQRRRARDVVTVNAAPHCCCRSV
jgi:hypothetical protein